MLIVPRNTPASIQQLYERAVQHMQEDLDYQGSITETIGNDQQIRGLKAQVLYRRAIVFAPKAKVFLRTWLAKKYQVTS